MPMLQLGKVSVHECQHPEQTQTRSQHPRVPPLLMAMLDHTNWELSECKFTAPEILHYFSHMARNECLLLNLNWNKYNRIVREIQHIDFSQLIQLRLAGNNIDSVDSLALMALPRLSNLILSDNRIVSLRPIVHMAAYSVGLEFLNLERNHLGDEELITQVFSQKEGEMACFVVLGNRDQPRWLKGSLERRLLARLPRSIIQYC